MKLNRRHTTFLLNATLSFSLTLLASAAWPQALSKFHSTSRKAVCGSPQPVFTAPPGEDTEDVAITPDGDVLTAEAYSGKIYRIKPDGSAEVMARLFPPGQYPNLVCSGVLLGSDGDLYVLANTYEAPTHGVWRVHQDGTFEQYAAIPPNGSDLNEMTWDDSGNLFVTDSLLGAIWKVSEQGTNVQLWCISDLLIWRNDPTGPFGANGIAFRNNTLYVAVTDAGTGVFPNLRGQNYPVVKVPILQDGSAGAPEVLISDNLLLVPDGLRLDKSGKNLYVVDFGGLTLGYPGTGPAKLVRYSVEEGQGDVVASDGLQNSASVEIKGHTAYVTNLYVTDVPNIVKIKLCGPDKD